MSQWSAIRERVADKWQIPLFVLSVCLLAGSFFRIPTKAAGRPWPEAIEQLDRLVSRGHYDRALVLGYTLLQRDGSGDERGGPVHLALARARFGQGIEAQITTSALGRKIIEHYRQADRFALPLMAEDFHRLGLALEWQGIYRKAYDRLKQALEKGCGHEADVRRYIIELARGRLDASPTELNEMLGEMLGALADHRLDLRIWAVEGKLEALGQLDRIDDASTLLVAERSRFVESDYRDRFNYLEALQLYNMGQQDEAETYLRTIRNRVQREDEVYAQTGWLLGRVVMSDGGPQRPEEAMSFFSDVLAHHPDGEYGVASQIGMAEALAYLERDDEAVEFYETAIERLAGMRPTRVVSREVLLVSLGVMSDYQRQSGSLESALAYARLGLALLDRRNEENTASYLQHLTMIQTPLATELERQGLDALRQSPLEGQALVDRARRLFSEAAGIYVELSRLRLYNEQESATASWRAAEFFARAMERDRAVELFREFVRERPQSVRIPRARYRIGQLLQALGRFDEAVEAFQECYRRHPRTLDGSRSLIPLAQCYLAIGPGNEELAEKALNVALQDSDVLTPLAPEYAEAFYLLGDVLNRRADYERAIASIEESLERYPDHEAAPRARFLLADSYRQSALSLKRDLADATFDGEYQQILAASSDRFAKARELYHEMVEEFESRGVSTLNRLDSVYYRHSALYEADSYFETRDYRRALKLYEEAAATFKESTSGLAAYVQIINCRVFLGEHLEARTALARALMLTEALPSRVFQDSVLPEQREDWKRYFEWLGESELF